MLKNSARNLSTLSQFRLMRSAGRAAVVADIGGGLGNRVRALLSAANLAEEIERDFFFSWRSSAKFEAPSNLVWRFPGTDIGRFAGIPLGLKWGIQDPLNGEIVEQRVIVFRTAHAINLLPTRFSWQERFRQLRPSAEHAAEIERYYRTELSGVRYVGVMVRAAATTHNKTRVSSPPGWFLNRMKELRAEDPEIEFFLSCDDVQTTTWLMKKMDRVHCRPKIGRINSRQGISEAAIDLYLLSGSCGLLGPYWSSFVELAQALRPSLLLETADSPEQSRLNPSTFLPRDTFSISDLIWQ